jgi:hypothetical protein
VLLTGTQDNPSAPSLVLQTGEYAFYVDDGYLYDYETATILCPWPKAGVAQCHAIDAQYQYRWRNTPGGLVADGREFGRDEITQQIRRGLF